MPRATEQLTRRSSMEQIRRAISSTIRTLIREGEERDRAAAIAYREARDRTGRTLKRKRRRGAVR